MRSIEGLKRNSADDEQLACFGPYGSRPDRRRGPRRSNADSICEHNDAFCHEGRLLTLNCFSKALVTASVQPRTFATL